MEWLHKFTLDECEFTDVWNRITASAVALAGPVSHHCLFTSFFLLTTAAWITELSVGTRAYYHVFFIFRYSFYWRFVLAKVWKEEEFWNLEIPAPWELVFDLFLRETLFYMNGHTYLELLVKMVKILEA